MVDVMPDRRITDPLVDAPFPPREGNSENLVLFGYDAASGISLWTHLGRLVPDPTVWEAVLVVALPDGHLLHHRSIGRSVMEPATGDLVFECLEPGQRWRVRLDGPAHRVDKSAARRRPVGLMHLPGSAEVVDPYEYVQVDVEFTGSYPTCDTGVSDQGWGKLHLHQLGRATGQIRWAGGQATVDLVGARDHTRGPRDVADVGGEWWATGIFPSGKAFDLFQIWTRSGSEFSLGLVWNGSEFVEATGMSRVRVSNPDGEPVSFDISVSGIDGPDAITGEALDVFDYTLIRPIGLAPGYHAVDDDTLVMVESPARFEWGGEIGHGWIERCGAVRDFRGTGR